MVFTSLEFLIFFAIVYPLYLILPFRWQNRMLLVASYVFYGLWDWRFLGLMILSPVSDYVLAIRIADSANDTDRKRYIILSIVVNLSILGFFKYCNFFVSSAVVL